MGILGTNDGAVCSERSGGDGCGAHQPAAGGTGWGSEPREVSTEDAADSSGTPGRDGNNLIASGAPVKSLHLIIVGDQ